MKTITMDYDEYLAELEKVKTEIEGEARSSAFFSGLEVAFESVESLFLENVNALNLYAELDRAKWKKNKDAILIAERKNKIYSMMKNKRASK